MSRHRSESDTGRSNSPASGALVASSRSQRQLLTPFQRKQLQKSLQDDLPEKYRQRIEIMLMADEGKSQTQICKALGCSQGTARHWIFMAGAGMAHCWNDTPIGRPKTVSEEYLQRLKQLVCQSPREFGYAFRRWTAQWLGKHLAKEFGIELSDRHISRLLKNSGLSTRSQPAPADGTAPQTGTRLVIGDLTAADAPELAGLWPFNSIR
ncbi:helix-turn-helix domain-containing protein [Kamptonema formosum]|uniref:helix-turn-helix domain-containing protein n=1 Tax=Kamptonema formosum TaxID=331992 RepID=UPI00036777C1|nr:helix-turn-helix domain-containing protein [Oscillatoria sp. PCC 10802]